MRKQFISPRLEKVSNLNEVTLSYGNYGQPGHCGRHDDDDSFWAWLFRLFWCKMRCICHYQFDRDGRRECEGANIYDFKDGFWIDGEGKLSNQASGMCWIPPSRIYYIEKVEKIEGD